MIKFILYNIVVRCIFISYLTYYHINSNKKICKFIEMKSWIECYNIQYEITGSMTKLTNIGQIGKL